VNIKVWTRRATQSAQKHVSRWKRLVQEEAN